MRTTIALTLLGTTLAIVAVTFWKQTSNLAGLSGRIHVESTSEVSLTAQLQPERYEKQKTAAPRTGLRQTETAQANPKESPASSVTDVSAFRQPAPTHSGDTTKRSATTSSRSPSAMPAQAVIPKIIHFTFRYDPRQSGNWPNPIWKFSFDSWKKHFPEPEYRYRFWTDDDARRQFQTHCPQHVRMFNSFQNAIARSDVARYCILHEVGGIYADLDYEPRQRFYKDFKQDRVNLVESPYPGETFQNSLMASPPGQKFWHVALDKVEVLARTTGDPVGASGPRMFDALRESKDPKVVYKLPCLQFQLKTHSDSGKPSCPQLSRSSVDSVKGIHWGTWSWVDGKTGDGLNKNGETQTLFQTLHR